ncbi:MAG: M56 family metallopeptidase [bacterium]|nr:M56 family metallopeptidase [bacterium]
MTVAITKKKIAGAVALTIVAIVAAETLVLRAGWHILSTDKVGECACLGQAGITGGQWTILGFGALFIAGWIFGIGTYLRTVIKTRKMLRALKSVTLSKEGLAVFQGGLCEAFTFGMIKPRIAICAHCIETLPKEELKAMLAHEEAHARSRDPLWFLLLDVTRALFFFVPLIRQFSQWFRTAAELAADDHVENRKALGGALLKTVERIQRAPQVSLAISSFASQVEERIERLLNPTWYAQRRLHRASLFISLVILFGSIGSLYGGEYKVVEDRISCRGPIQSTPCGRSFDGNSNQYYNSLIPKS